MAGKVKPIPDGYHTVTPYLIVGDAARAIEFYKQAFGAVEVMRMDGPAGKVGHAEIRIGDSPIMLADEFPDCGTRSPESLGARRCRSISTSRTWMPSSRAPWRPAQRLQGQCRTSSTATGRAD
jgi:catechol 2,3-dioxygenase-like lactoylglutathione lyase family enzyme